MTVYCCVRNRQNTWLDFVNILLSISDLVQNVQKGYLWNYKSCKGGIDVVYNCAKFHIPVSCLHVANVLKYFIKL